MSKVFYMPANDLFGVWKNSGDAAGLPEPKEDVSVFKFAQKDGGKAASYSVCDGISAHRAILSGLRRGWTSASCDSKDFAPARATEVVMVKDGIADLQPDGSWKVLIKAIIDFKE
jgi:hypothetical protein